ncbi:DUF2851 family protein [Hymenobacter sp. J193]|uniref:DUF2851 family protein n=1 Tax=Hymenobacter sp. J193 TaxID=2898429 RepID=UPI002150B3AC|nr:DUF2851 family protein [Hymenobacter sp. J193]MCR5886363.1 DUF2851 family protein [Hymenobacter sp. J193]
MQEDFLHYVWQQQYFDKVSLHTQEGELLTVLRPGFRHQDAGPDFPNARVRIGEVEWNGAVEIHLRASDWHRHQHHLDRRYDQVILHVVHTADEPVRRTDGTLIPTLELGPRLAPELLHTYQELLAAPPATLPCAGLLPQVPTITRLSMVERALLERADRKAATVLALHEQLLGDWEATTWHALAAGFGFQKNTEPLTRLAKALPLSVLRRHRYQLLQTEALLLGQAGFLADTDASDDHKAALVREYSFLRHKYELAETALQAHEWNFLRLRPANFPTARLVQLAALLHARPTLFAALLAAADVPTLEAFFRVPLADYWHKHTRPGRPGKLTELGRDSVHLLISNVVVPLRVAYARHVGQSELAEEAVNLLAQLPAEHNRLLAPFEALGFQNKSAADSQGLLTLQREYCQPRRCLHCAIGNRILRQNPLVS